MYQALQTPQGWLLHGVAIRGKALILQHTDSALATFWKLLRSYFERPAAHAELHISHRDRVWKTTCDSDGFFSILLHKEDIAGLNFSDNSGKPIQILGDYTRLFKHRPTPLMAISDIDDTILVSHSARLFSRLWLMLFKPTPRRRPVEANEKAFAKLHQSGIPFAYISASEYNLFPLVATFIQVHGIPEGPIYLRPLQHWSNLLKQRRRLNYKIQAFTRLLPYLPDYQFILFGDDSQHDWEVFLEIQRRYPQRIKAIFLRKTQAKNSTLEAPHDWPSHTLLFHYTHYSEIDRPLAHILHETTTRSQSGLGH